MAQEGQPSENGSENPGRAGLAPPPSAMFDFRFQQKKKKQQPSPGRAAAARKPPPACPGGGPCSPIPSFPVPPWPLLTPLLPAHLHRATHPQKGAARAPGRWKPSPALNLQPVFCSTRHGEVSGMMPMSLLCCLPVCPCGRASSTWGRGWGRGRSSGAGAGTSGLDALGDANGTRRSQLARKALPQQNSELGRA